MYKRQSGDKVKIAVPKTTIVSAPLVVSQPKMLLKNAKRLVPMNPNKAK